MNCLAMNRPGTFVAFVAFALCAMTTGFLVGCDNATNPPGRRAIDKESVAPDKTLDFDVLYGTNCAACHGPQGRDGAAPALANPVYLAIADSDILRRVTADGVAGTPMPAFARRSGGMLTDQQIDALVRGIRTRWANPSAVATVTLPPYVDSSPGDARRGGAAFAAYCASCHGDDGRGGRPGQGVHVASSIVDGAYLALVSDQGLRTMVIVGRPDLGAPDWRGNIPGRAMAFRDISDVVAWLSAQRPERGTP
jgi:cytochrome c oxidase cbb3-type subunit 3